MTPAAQSDVAGGLQEHGDPGIEIIQEVHQQSFQGLRLLGGAVLFFTLVREHNVRDLEGQLLRKVGNGGHMAGDYAVAQDDVSLQAAGRRIRESATLLRELPRFANVVEDRTEEQQVLVERVDLCERSRHP